MLFGRWYYEYCPYRIVRGGKSTLGVLLAKALGMDFVDTDIVIQQREGRLLQEIIDSGGADKFLEREEANRFKPWPRRLRHSHGGSVVYSAIAMKTLGKRP